MNDQPTTPIGVAKIREALQRMLHVGGKLKTSLEKVYEFNTKADRSGAEFNRKEWDALEYVAHETLAELDAPPIVGVLTDTQGHLPEGVTPIDSMAHHICLSFHHLKPFVEDEDDQPVESIAYGEQFEETISLLQYAFDFAREQGYLAQAPQSPAPSVIEAVEDFATLPISYAHEHPLEWDAKRTLLLTLVRQAKASRPSVSAPVIAWHKAGEFPPEQIPEGHILIGYSNRVGKDEDYSLRQLACYPDKGPWTDWYSAVPNPDHWAIIPIPDKDIARWHMPKRATPPVTAPTYAMSRDYEALYSLLKAGEQVLVWVTHKDTDYPAVAERMLGGCSVSSLGHTFFNAIACSTERTLFVTECTRLNLEWLSPAAQGVTVDEEKCVHCGRLRSTPDEPNL